MSTDTIPNQTYFNGLIYNSNFYLSGNVIRLNYATTKYLKRTGANATSNAITTSCSGNVNVNGLSKITDVSIGGNIDVIFLSTGSGRKKSNLNLSFSKSINLQLVFPFFLLSLSDIIKFLPSLS